MTFFHVVCCIVVQLFVLVIVTCKMYFSTPRGKYNDRNMTKIIIRYNKSGAKLTVSGKCEQDYKPSKLIAIKSNKDLQNMCI